VLGAKVVHQLHQVFFLVMLSEHYEEDLFYFTDTLFGVLSGSMWLSYSANPVCLLTKAGGRSI